MQLLSGRGRVGDVLPLSERYCTTLCHIVHLVDRSGYSVPPQVLWRQQSACRSNPHDDLQPALVQYVFKKHRGCWRNAFQVCFTMCGALVGLVFIRAGVKRAHKRSARTAYRKTILMLSGIPCQNCSSLLFLVYCSWTDQSCYLQLASRIPCEPDCLLHSLSRLSE